MKPDQAQRLKALEAENMRLKDEVAILTVDKLILGEIVEDTNREVWGNNLPGDEQ
jgi:hypothetical protein